MTGTPFAAAARSLVLTKRTYVLRRLLLLTALAGLIGGGFAVASTVTARSSEIEAVAGDAQIEDTREPASLGSEPASLGSEPASLGSEATTPPDESMPSRASRFVVSDPERLLDTRTGDSIPGPTHAEVISVPANLTAVVLSISAIGAVQSGAVFVDGSAGTIEALTIGQASTATNLVIVPVLGNDITVTTTSGGHLVVDLIGTFEPSETSRSGRFVALSPNRIVQLETAIDGPDAQLAFGRSLRAGTTAVLVSISGEVGDSGGMVRLGQLPESFDQMLMWAPVTGNDDGVRQSLAIIRPTENFVAALRYEGGRTLSVDVLGYFTDEHADASSDGLYVPSGPRRLFSGELNPETPFEATGIEPMATSAVVVVGSSDSVGVGLGSTLLPVREGTMSMSAATLLDARVTLLGVFL